MFGCYLENSYLYNTKLNNQKAMKNSNSLAVLEYKRFKLFLKNREAESKKPLSQKTIEAIRWQAKLSATLFPNDDDL